LVPNIFRRNVRRTNSFPDIKVFFSSDRNRNFKSTFPAHYAIAKTGDYEIVNYFTASTKETIICTSCAFLKKRFERYRNFDTQIKSGQDTDMWIVLGYIPYFFFWKILARYVYDEKSLSKNKTI
jgi:hypothetical protein